MDVLSFSDASDFAWDGFLVNIGKNIAKGVFSEAEANSSSTWRELKPPGMFWNLLLPALLTKL